MIIVCKMRECGYWRNGFCASPHAVSIDEFGMCGAVWRKGQRKQLFRATEVGSPHIQQGEWKEIKEE